MVCLNTKYIEIKMNRASPHSKLPGLYSCEYSFDPAGNRTALRRELHQKPPFAGENKKLGDFVALCENKKTKPSFWDLPGLMNFSYVYDKENRLLKVFATRDDTTYVAEYEYDNNGNLIKKTERKDRQEHLGFADNKLRRAGKSEASTLHSSRFTLHETNYLYDYENRLIAIGYPDRTTSEYYYNGVGKRIKTIENSHENAQKVTKFLYDGLNVIIELDGDDNTVASYVRGLSYGGGIGGIISVTKTEPEYNNHKSHKGHRKWHKYRPDPSTYYYHYNGIGSITALTDEQGGIIQEYEYDAYGNLVSVDGDISNPYQFSTKEYSSKSGLSYFGARYYDARVGRFITKDPLKMINGPNMYLYCSNNPMNWIDPWGLKKERGWKVSPDIARLLAEIISGADVLPIGAIPTIPQAIGEILDIGAFLSTEAIYIFDYTEGRLSGHKTIVASVLNLTNLGVGTMGNVTSTVPNLALSAVELGIVSLQSKVTSDTWNPFPETTKLTEDIFNNE